MRSIRRASTVASPPARSVRTSESPSTRCDLTDRVRPVLKNTNSARAGAATTTNAISATARNTVFSILPWVYERMKNADSKLARVAAVGCRHERRHVRLVDDDVNLAVFAAAKLVGRQRNLFQFLFPRLQRELLQRLAVQRQLHVLRFFQDAARTVHV